MTSPTPIRPGVPGLSLALPPLDLLRPGISRNVLTRRLNRLVGNDILSRVPHQDHPPRSEYRLTDKGEARR